jgi:hypothetical protein
LEDAVKTYLGDGLYAEFDGFQIKVYASDGIRVTNEVFFEGETITAFLEFLEQVKEMAR